MPLPMNWPTAMRTVSTVTLATIINIYRFCQAAVSAV
jgi:hypothetical protein